MVIREMITRLGFQVDESGLKKGEAKAIQFGTMAKAGMLAAVAGITAFGIAGVKAAASQELHNSKLAVMLGSEEKALKLVAAVEKMGLANAVSMETLEAGTQKLVRAGVSAERIPKILGIIGDVAMGDEEKMSELTTAWSRMSATGVVGSRELMMMGRAAEPIYGVLAKQLGVNQEELKKMGAAGKISVGEIEKAFNTMTSSGGQFYMGMAKVNQSFSGLMVILKNNLEELAESFGNILMPPLKVIMTTVVGLLQGPLGDVLRSVFELLTPIMNFISQLIGSLSPAFVQIGRILNIVGGVLGKLLTAIGPSLEPIVGILTDVLTLVADILEMASPLIDMMLAAFGKNIQHSIGMIALVIKGVVWVLQKVFKILFDSIDYYLPVIQWLLNKMESVYNWFVKLFHLTNLMKKDSKDAMKDVKNDIAGDQKNLNLNMNNEINVNAPMGGPGMTGLSPSGAGSAMADAARGVFTMELKKVLISAM